MLQYRLGINSRNLAMFGDDIVVETRLSPPRLPRRWLRRSRLDRLLANAADYPVTVVSASAGYGKSSALASFAARGGWPVIWYSLGQSAADPLVFLLHLVHACRRLAPQAGARAIALLEQHSQGTQSWGQALDSLINDLARTLDDETILVLDDAHIADQASHTAALIERLIEHAPARLHLLLASRHTLALASLPILQARGELYAIDERALAFDPDEIGALFEAIEGQPLSSADAAAIHEQTDGWPIALQLLQQGTEQIKDERRKTNEASLLPSSFVLRPASLSHDLLFTYLAQEVLAGQSPEIQSFLLRSAVLSELDARTCDHVLGGTDSAATLRALYRRGLFLVALDDQQYRYHPLFRAFLQQRARARLPDWAELHGRAAAFYRAIGQAERALDHLLAIEDSAGLAGELTRLAQLWIEAGRLVTLLSWLDRLPAATLAAQPQLMIAQGDALRMLARFDDALAAYAEAERYYTAHADPVGQSLALRGQAQIYLDTVRPAPAQPLLRRAFKLLPPERREGRASLLRLIAENRLNSGRADQAARLYRVAGSYSLIDDPSGPDARVFLRLGRLVEARAILEGQLLRGRAMPSGGRRPEGHREPTLLLSLVCALLGDPQAALCYAREGLEAARQVGSALSEAIAHIRMGNALQLVASDAAAAQAHYEQAMALADAFAVPRTKAAAYLGLTLLHGFSGDLGAARAHAEAGLAIVERSGDAWTAARLWAALGAVGATYGALETEQWLDEALRRHQVCKDIYSQTVVLLYYSIWHHSASQLDDAQRFAIEALRLARRYRYSGLLTMPTLFGPRDRMALVPILLAGRATAELRGWASEQLARGFPRIAADDETQLYHPGSTLRIQLLDRLRVWRGTTEVEPRAWQRKKAPQLLALLLTNRHIWLAREQICDMLWIDTEPSDAETQFKVTLNALNAVLEPARSPRTPAFYIRRQGSAYRFAPPDGAWLDVAAFEERADAALALVAAGDRGAQALRQLAGALGLYRGDYLADYLYDDWAAAERERLKARYIEAATPGLPRAYGLRSAR
jgi:hypothetical protein